MRNIDTTEALVNVGVFYRFGDLRSKVNDFVSLAGMNFEFHPLLHQLSRYGLPKSPGFAPFSNVGRHTRLLHKRLSQKSLIDHISPATLANNSLGFFP